MPMRTAQPSTRDRFVAYRQAATDIRNDGNWCRLIEAQHVVSPATAAHITATTGVVTAKELMDGVQAASIIDPVAVDVAFKLIASMSRTRSFKCVPVLRKITRAVTEYRAETGHSVAIEPVGEYARHYECVSALELCMCVPKKADATTLIQRISWYIESPVPTQANDQVRFVCPIDGRQTLIVIHIYSVSNYRAGVLYRTGPTKFIEMLNRHLMRHDYELTDRGLKSTQGHRVAVRDYACLMQDIGIPRIPASMRDTMTSLTDDMSHQVSFAYPVGDAGIAIPDNFANTEFEASELAYVTEGLPFAGVTFIASGDSVKDEARVVALRGINLTCPKYIGVVVTGATRSAISLAKGGLVDYVILEDDNQATLLDDLLPVAHRAGVRILVRNPICIMHGVDGSGASRTLDDVCRTVNRHKAIVDICGADVYAGASSEALRRITKKCRVTLSSATSEVMSIPYAMSNAVAKASRAHVLKSRSVTTDADMIGWLSPEP